MRLAGIALVTLLCGCVGPQPIYQLVPVAIGNASMPAQQAAAICHPKAQAAGYRAANEVRAVYAGRQNQVTGYHCTFSGSTGDCDAKTRGGSPYDGIMQGQDERGAQTSMESAVFAECMAHFGWGLENQCVRNCGEYRAEPASTSKGFTNNAASRAAAAQDDKPIGAACKHFLECAAGLYCDMTKKTCQKAGQGK